MSESINAVLQKLKRFDQISVAWIDASQSSNVSIAGKIPNHAVETKVISDGRFLGVQTSDYYKEPHLLVLKDCSDSSRGTVQSIPVVLVKKILVFGKIPLLIKKGSRGGATTFRIRYADGVVKTVRIPERSSAG